MNRIALIAHDEKKESLVAFVKKHRDQLSKYEIVATNTTGTNIEHATGLRVWKMLSGPLGGDLQIGAMIAEDKISAVIFLRDPLTADVDAGATDALDQCAHRLTAPAAGRPTPPDRSGWRLGW